MNLTKFDYITIFFAIIIMILIISSIIEYIIDFFYIKLQRYYIKNSDKHYYLYEKLLLINYYVYYQLEKFFAFIKPFKIYNDKNIHHFNPKVFSYSFRDTIKSIGAYAILGYLLKIAIQNFDKIHTFITNINIIESFKILLLILYENKWYILALLSAVSIIYGIYKNKYTNKLLEEFQDEELKEIIELYKKLSLELIDLEMLLLQNIKKMLTSYKKDGVFVFLFTSIEQKIDFCKYDRLKNILIVNENSFTYSRLSTKGITLENITQTLDNIKNVLNEYDKKEHFYRLYTINKYFKGLSDFDIERFIKSPQSLIDDKYINERIDDVIETYNIMIEDEETPRQYIIDKLNKNIIDENTVLYTVIRESIEKVIKIDIFNRRLRKSMSLKKYRDKFPIDNLISNIK